MAEWKKVIVSGSVAELAAVSASVGIVVTGDVKATTFTGDGSGLTGVAAGSINIDGFTAGTTLDQADVFLYSDNQTEKKITFSNIEDEIFGNVSGDATIAAGGALTIANDAVEQAMIADDAVGADQLASDSVVEASIVDGNVTNAKLANNAVATANIVDANVTAAKLASSAVTNAKLATNAVTTVKITDANVTTAKLADGAVTAAKLDGTIGLVSGSTQIRSDIETLADGRIAAASVADLSDVSDAGSGEIITDAERTKLGGIATGAEVNVDTNITVSEGANTVEIQSSTGTNDSIAAATTSAAGVMTAADKTKLDGIETSADVTDATNVTSGLVAATGISSGNKTTIQSNLGVDAAGTDNSTLSGLTATAIGKSIVTGSSASAIRSTIGVDAAGTDNSTNVTLAGSRDYITISGQTITRNQIDISDDTNLTAGTGVTLTGDTLSIGQEVGTSDDVQFRNITATGDLTVQGELTSLQTTNLNIEDQFILLNSGSSDAQTQGIIFGGTTGTQGSGEAFFYDLDADRPAWSRNAVAWDATDAADTAYIPRVFDVDGSSHVAIAEVGSIQISGGDIFIYG